MRRYKKFVPLLSVLVVSGLLTLGSLVYSRKELNNICVDYAFTEPTLNTVQRGFPLPYLLLKSSVSLCQPVESLSVLRFGNAYHEQYYVNAAVNYLFWLALASTPTYLVFRVIRHRRKR